MGSDLKGRTVLITRSPHQANQFRRLLELLGARVLEVPTIELCPRPSSEIDPAASRVGGWHWLVFTSANAVEIFLGRCRELGTLVQLNQESRPRVCAVGPATANAIQGFELTVDLLPRSFHAEGVVEAFEQSHESLANLRILLPIASAARSVLPEGLSLRGAEVTVLPVYDTLPAEGSRPLLRLMLKGGDPELVALTSSSTARNFFNLCLPDLDPTRFAYASIGPVTTRTCLELGISPIVQAAESTVPGLVQAILDALGRDG